jgi:hypothetical protein
MILQLSRIIYLFSSNMHDASLSLSIHTTCARLMLNLVHMLTLFFLESLNSIVFYFLFDLAYINADLNMCYDMSDSFFVMIFVGILGGANI